MKVLFTVICVIAHVSATRSSVTVRNTCDNIPSVPHKGPGCGIPDYIPDFDIKTFGNNNRSHGILRISPHRRGLDLKFKLYRLPVPDLILTAWIQWIDPTDPNKPKIFKVGADYVSPCASFRAKFTYGFGREPNQFKYVSRKNAVLNAQLNFNPTYPNEGALARMTYCFQKDIPGIQKTEQRQFPNPRTSEYVPQSSAFLRKYDEKTGFEILRKDGRPKVVRSPTRAVAVIIASHLDRTTHGITPGNFMTDHYDLMVFPLEGIVVGRRTV